jgi:hypothetical protein
MDFSLQLLPEQPLAELIDVIGVADKLGFRACYSADGTYHKDMWILFAAAAPRTHRGDVEHALALTTSEIGERLSIACAVRSSRCAGSEGRLGAKCPGRTEYLQPASGYDKRTERSQL